MAAHVTAPQPMQRPDALAELGPRIHVCQRISGAEGGNAGACVRAATRVGGHARGEVGHDSCTIEDRPHAEVYGEQEAREGSSSSKWAAPIELK